MSETIWVVGGSTGEYSDRTEWVVDAWRSEAEAQARVTFLTEKMQELGITHHMDWEIREQAVEKMREHVLAFAARDPGLAADSVGAEGWDDDYCARWDGVLART